MNAKTRLNTLGQGHSKFNPWQHLIISVGQLLIFIVLQIIVHDDPVY